MKEITLRNLFKVAIQPLRGCLLLYEETPGVFPHTEIHPGLSYSILSELREANYLIHTFE